MLDQRVYELAERAFKAKKPDEVQAFYDSVGHLQAELASKGIVGGAGGQLLLQTGSKHARALVTLASNELIRACTSLGIRARRDLSDDLIAALVRITGPDADEIARFLTMHVKVHIYKDADGWTESMISIAQSQERGIANANLSHFAADLEKNSNAKRMQLVYTFLGGGAALKIGETIFNWAYHALANLHR